VSGNSGSAEKCHGQGSSSVANPLVRKSLKTLPVFGDADAFAGAVRAAALQQIC
jgi:hypothetical protein